MKRKTTIFLISAALLLSSCAAKRQNVDACVEGNKDGFLKGVWHGMICPIVLLYTIFEDDASAYSPNNTGSWYTVGFIMGIGAWVGGGSSGARRR